MTFHYRKLYKDRLFTVVFSWIWPDKIVRFAENTERNLIGTFYLRKNLYMKKVIALIILFGSTLSAEAQIGGGGKVGFDYYLGGSGVKTISLAGFVDWQKDDEYGLRFGLGYGLPNKQTDTYTANALSTATDPEYISVTGDFKVSFIHLTTDFKKYFGRGEYDDGGFYGSLGIGYSLAMAKTTYDYGLFDESEYTVTGTSDEGSREIIGQFMLRGFIGYEFDADFAKIFSEFGLSFPANNVNGVSVGINLPPFVQLAVGLRF
ncbi:MAG: hypothetical protein ACI8ZM_004111 [Crocinitomix sp.]|jgi:hypothetical protein